MKGAERFARVLPCWREAFKDTRLRKSNVTQLTGSREVEGLNMLAARADSSGAVPGAVARNGKAGPSHRHQRSSSDPFQQGSSELRQRKQNQAVQPATPQTPQVASDLKAT